MQELKPLSISIVTPSFNQGHFLGQTMASVLSQGYENLEYVIIDGGSTDHSVNIIKSHQDQLTYWVSEKDEGHAHAINKGFACTTGEIMGWINSDDMYTPWALKNVSRIFAKFPHVQWIVGFNSYWNSEGAMTYARRMPKNIYDFLLGDYQWIQQESVFWRRSLWDATGGYMDQNYKLMVDGELWTRFFLHADLYAVDCIFGGYRSHTENRAAQYLDECHREMELAIGEMKSRCSPDVLKTYSELERLKKLSKFRIGRSIVNRLGKPCFGSAFERAGYGHIVWENEAWQERKLPFWG